MGRDGQGAGWAMKWDGSGLAAIGGQGWAGGRLGLEVGWVRVGGIFLALALATV